MDMRTCRNGWYMSQKQHVGPLHAHSPCTIVHVLRQSSSLAIHTWCASGKLSGRVASMKQDIMQSMTKYINEHNLSNEDGEQPCMPLKCSVQHCQIMLY